MDVKYLKVPWGDWCGDAGDRSIGLGLHYTDTIGFHQITHSSAQNGSTDLRARRSGADRLKKRKKL